MKTIVRTTICALFTFLCTTPVCAEHQDRTIPVRAPHADAVDVEWLVIGGGPAGIMSVGLLHDLGIPYDAIGWTDPEFRVGRLGAYYYNVPANNTTQQFIDFIASCDTFQECNAPSLEKLYTSDPNEFPHLGAIVDPLQDISTYLQSCVTSITGHVASLYFDDGVWHAQVENRELTARNVILATGCHPKELNYGHENVIPLDDALDKQRLAGYLNPDETVGVFGSSHSAILLLKFLSDLNAHRIINFYRSHLVYAVDMGDWVMNAAHGLKGETARWAREVLEQQPPKTLIRAYSNEENRNDLLPLCDKVIYAVGYAQNPNPLTHDAPLPYDPENGVIAPRLFGIGIAFPELHDNHGQQEYRIGLASFMEYAQRVMVTWIEGAQRTRHNITRRHQLEKFEQLFNIQML